MAVHEIVLPETKPETEWIDGQPVQKVSPTYDHGLLQRRIAARIGAWADETDSGRVASEWRFRVGPLGDVIRPLVPDVGYLSFDDFRRDADRREVQVPLAAPTVAVEILSPDDRPRHLASKIATYLAAGTRAIVVVDPDAHTVTVHDGTGVRTYAGDDVLTHASMPGFQLEVAPLFARMN